MGRYGVLGSTIFPVALFYWYRFLDAKLVGTAARTVVAKVITDQAISSPLVLVTFYVGGFVQAVFIFVTFSSSFLSPPGMSIMAGKKNIFAECREKFWTTYMVSSSSSTKIWGFLLVLLGTATSMQRR